jgi:hypothetical protein
MSGEGAADFLRFPCSNNFFYGFDSLFASYTEKVMGSHGSQAAEAQLVRSAIDRLARSLAILRTPNPEAPGHRPMEGMDVESILSRIGLNLGFNISFPNPYPDEFGIATSRGIASLRAVFALYQAALTRSLSLLCKNKSALEIGAGLGRTAYYAYMAGVTEYFIVDLPLANAAQAYFLGTSLGEHKIRLASEFHPAPIHIATPADLNKFTPGIALNADSLTEMDRSFAKQYVGFARERAEIFISINHEVNEFTARNIIDDEILNAFVMRYPHPMRDGYVEDIVFLNAAPAAGLSR